MKAWPVRGGSTRKRSKACGREPAAHGDDTGPAVIATRIEGEGSGDAVGSWDLNIERMLFGSLVTAVTAQDARQGSCAWGSINDKSLYRRQQLKLQ